LLKLLYIEQIIQDTWDKSETKIKKA
jgi:hypothetical protein